jgi:hypothetical protein
MGPLLAAFMTETLRWPVPFWVYFSMNILALALVICFLQETYYDRGIPADEQPARGNRLARLMGIAQWKSRHLRNTFGQACWRTASVLLKPIIAISCVFYALVSLGHHASSGDNMVERQRLRLFDYLDICVGGRHQHNPRHLCHAALRLRAAPGWLLLLHPGRGGDPGRSDRALDA